MLKMKNLPVYKRINIATVLVFTVVFLIAGCNNKEYTVTKGDNPVYKPNTSFETFEDMTSDRADHLISKYRLDTVFNGEQDEFIRILMLRHWIKSVIPIEDYGDPYPGEGNVERILDYAMEGQGYHCGHYMRVQNAVMTSMGYVTRSLGAGPGVQGTRFEHHGTNEIWSNTHNKWFLSDAKYDHHFEKDGVPLSAVEIRNEYLKNEAADILMVKGVERKPLDYDEEVDMSKKEFAQTYTWITWDAYSDMFTDWPEHNVMLIMYGDNYYKNNTWIRGTRPHWIYNSPENLRVVENIDEIYFTPNTIASNVTIDNNTARIQLDSYTPGFKEYQMKRLPGDEWETVGSELEIELKNKKYEFVFRTMNHAGVTGPEHKIVLER
jgi:hypothetical protein